MQTSKSPSWLSVKLLLISVLVLVIFFMVIRTDTNPIGLRVHEFLDDYRHPVGTMNGFFVNQDNNEECFYFEQSGQKFATKARSDISRSIFHDISGTFTTQNGGTVRVTNAEGEVLSFNEFSLILKGEGTSEKEIFIMEPASDSSGKKFLGLKRVKRRYCARKYFDISCMNLANEEINEEWVASDDYTSLDKLFVGTWKSTSLGGRVMMTSKQGRRGEYHLKLEGLLRHIAPYGELIATKREGVLVHGIVRIFLRGDQTLDHRTVYDEDTKMTYVYNCDRSDTRWSLIKVDDRQDTPLKNKNEI